LDITTRIDNIIPKAALNIKVSNLVGENSFATFSPLYPLSSLTLNPKKPPTIASKEKDVYAKGFGTCNIKYYLIAFEKQNEWAC